MRAIARAVSWQRWRGSGASRVSAELRGHTQGTPKTYPSLDQERIFSYHSDMKTQTIEVDDSTALVLQQRAAERGVTVPELVAELATIAVGPVAADVDDVAELDRRWKAFEAQDSVASNDEVVRWLQTWGTSAFRSWRNR
jgi:hypothetical protein